MVIGIKLENFPKRTNTGRPGGPGTNDASRCSGATRGEDHDIAGAKASGGHSLVDLGAYLLGVLSRPPRMSNHERLTVLLGQRFNDERNCIGVQPQHDRQSSRPGHVPGETAGPSQEVVVDRPDEHRPPRVMR